MDNDGNGIFPNPKVSSIQRPKGAEDVKKDVKG